MLKPRLLSLLACAMLTGCGHVSAAAVDLAADEGNAATPVAAPVQLTSPSAAPTAVSITSPQAPSCLGLTDCVGTQLLALSGVAKASAGFLWRKRRVQGTVKNPAKQVLSGEVQIRFLKKGVVVETEYKTFSSMPGLSSKAFDLTSTAAADDAEVTITTGDDPSLAAPAASTAS